MDEIIYCYGINTESFAITEDSYEDDGTGFNPEDLMNKALYNEDGWEDVRAESDVSAEHARQLVLDLCDKLAETFRRCAEKIRKSKDG